MIILVDERLGAIMDYCFFTLYRWVPVLKKNCAVYSRRVTQEEYELNKEKRNKISCVSDFLLMFLEDEIIQEIMFSTRNDDCYGMSSSFIIAEHITQGKVLVDGYGLDYRIPPFEDQVLEGLALSLWLYQSEVIINARN